MFWERSRFYVAPLLLSPGRKPTPSPSATRGDGVAVSGILLGDNNGNGTWSITGITGTYNGIAIAGIVPLGADPSYIYNNLLYYPADPLFVDNDGILFNVPGIGE